MAETELLCTTITTSHNKSVKREMCIITRDCLPDCPALFCSPNLECFHKNESLSNYCVVFQFSHFAQDCVLYIQSNEGISKDFYLNFKILCFTKLFESKMPSKSFFEIKKTVI